MGSDGGARGDDLVMAADDVAAAFEAARPKLMAIAYRMLGSVVEAEDVVGDVAERWAGADHDDVRIPEAWLVATTTRRSLDVLRSARLQRESYPGVWLPEPVATGEDAGAGLERTETLTMGFLLLLERLTPIERAVFVLHDVLGYGHDEVADALGRAQPACRQALHRARKQVAVPKQRSSADRAQAARLAEQFLAAGASGDVDGLLSLLAPDVVLTSDGGGVVYAAMRPVVGRDRVGRFVTNMGPRFADARVEPRELNGSPGGIIRAEHQTFVLAIETEGAQITAIRAVLNPAKLDRLLAEIRF
jgi:RNA polymerase sigma-70 factor, ECF subfamily